MDVDGIFRSFAAQKMKDIREERSQSSNVAGDKGAHNVGIPCVDENADAQCSDSVLPPSEVTGKEESDISQKGGDTQLLSSDNEDTNRPKKHKKNKSKKDKHKHRHKSKKKKKKSKGKSSSEDEEKLNKRCNQSRSCSKIRLGEEVASDLSGVLPSMTVVKSLVMVADASQINNIPLNSVTVMNDVIRQDSDSCVPVISAESEPSTNKAAECSKTVHSLSLDVSFHLQPDTKPDESLQSKRVSSVISVKQTPTCEEHAEPTLCMAGATQDVATLPEAKMSKDSVHLEKSNLHEHPSVNQSVTPKASDAQQQDVIADQAEFGLVKTISAGQLETSTVKEVISTEEKLLGSVCDTCPESEEIPNTGITANTIKDASEPREIELVSKEQMHDVLFSSKAFKSTELSGVIVAGKKRSLSPDCQKDSPWQAERDASSSPSTSNHKQKSSCPSHSDRRTRARSRSNSSLLHTECRVKTKTHSQTKDEREASPYQRKVKKQRSTDKSRSREDNRKQYSSKSREKDRRRSRSHSHDDRKKKSRSRSYDRKRKSRSHSYDDRRKRSRSRSCGDKNNRRSRSASRDRRRCSRSQSRGDKRQRRSLSQSFDDRKKRSRSQSIVKRRNKSRSHSRGNRKKRSWSRSHDDRRKRRSRSQSHDRKRSWSRSCDDRKRRSRSKSHDRKRSRSRSHADRRRRSHSRSHERWKRSFSGGRRRSDSRDKRRKSRSRSSDDKRKISYSHIRNETGCSRHEQRRKKSSSHEDWRVKSSSLSRDDRGRKSCSRTQDDRGKKAVSPHDNQRIKSSSYSRNESKKSSRSHSCERKKRSRSGSRDTQSKLSSSPRLRDGEKTTSREDRNKSRSNSADRNKPAGNFPSDRSKMSPFSRKDRNKSRSRSPNVAGRSGSRERRRRSRSTSRKRRTNKSPLKLTELDKAQLLEIAKANASVVNPKVSVNVMNSIGPAAALFPLILQRQQAAAAAAAATTMANAIAATTASVAQLPITTITSVTAPGTAGTSTTTPAAQQLEVTGVDKIKAVVAASTKGFKMTAINDLTKFCKQITESKDDGGPLNKPVDSDDEDAGVDEVLKKAPFINHPFKLSEPKPIAFSLNNLMVKPLQLKPPQATLSKEFPVSSGNQHRQKEQESVYGQWVPVEKTTTEVVEDKHQVFPKPVVGNIVDLGAVITKRAVAVQRLAQNPTDMEAMLLIARSQRQIESWAQASTEPGTFTGSTGVQILSPQELANTGQQAWLKKMKSQGQVRGFNAPWAQWTVQSNGSQPFPATFINAGSRPLLDPLSIGASDQFLRAAPVNGGIGAQLMRKMGWSEGKGLGKNSSGSVEPIIMDFKTDRRGLLADGEKAQKKSGPLTIMKDLSGKHPVSALMEICTKRKWTAPDFIVVNDSGPDHCKNFLFKVIVNGCEYQPTTASPNKKHAKAMAATVVLQSMGLIPRNKPTS